MMSLAIGALRVLAAPADRDLILLRPGHQIVRQAESLPERPEIAHAVRTPELGRPELGINRQSPADELPRAVLDQERRVSSVTVVERICAHVALNC